MQQRMEVIALRNRFVNDWPIRDLIALDNQNLLEVIGNTRAVIRPAMLPPTTIACCPSPSLMRSTSRVWFWVYCRAQR